MFAGVEQQAKLGEQAQTFSKTFREEVSTVLKLRQGLCSSTAAQCHLAQQRTVEQKEN
jgi:hypothetical protein